MRIIHIIAFYDFAVDDVDDAQPRFLSPLIKLKPHAHVLMLASPQ